MVMRKSIEGIGLNKTIGRNYHRCTGQISGMSIVFEATLGYRSKKPIKWSAYYMPKAGKTDLAGEGISLKMCIKCAACGYELMEGEDESNTGV